MNELLKFRQNRGWTQEEMAQLLKTTKATVSRYESGDRSPAIGKLNFISTVTGIPRHKLRPDIFEGRAA